MTIGSDSSLGGVILARFLIKNGPIFKKTKFFTVSPPEGVQRRVRGQNRGFWAKQIHFWGFQTSPTPSSGQKLRRGPPPTPKKAGKLKTAISRPFLVQMSWFFAWDFVITYSVRKISRQPPDQPPAQPPVRAATRPTTFRRKLSDSADIRRVDWQSYSSTSYKKLALFELKRPRNRPENTIYSLRRALSRPFWFGLG